MLKQFIERFVAEEDGAVTVDWVVLCAAVVGLAVAVASTIKTQLDKSATDIATSIDAEVGKGLGN